MDNSNISFLSDFILQSQDGNLKTSSYQRGFADLKMKVSFGMGMPARVPWISFTAPGMTTSNGYYPVYLYYKERNLLILAYGINETAEYGSNWPTEIQNNHTKISDFIGDAPRYGDSFIFTTYTPHIYQNIVTFKREGQDLLEQQIQGELLELLNSYKSLLDIEVKDETSAVNSGLFYMEQQLEDFIIENWEETEFGKKLELIKEDGVLKSQQYQTDIGRMDIFAKDRNTDSYVVIELKKNQTSDDTVGQILRYMGWVQEHLGDRNVRGIIVAGKYDEKLYYAQNMISSVDVFLYEVNFSLKEYKK